MIDGLVTGEDIRAWRTEILLDGPDAGSCILGGWRECFTEAEADAEWMPSVAHMMAFTDLRWSHRERRQSSPYPVAVGGLAAVGLT